MPNKKDTIKIINDAFQSSNKKVIALKGGWGIGKTYLWKEIAEKNDKHSVFDFCHKLMWLFSSKVRAKKEYKIGYVSLFGKKNFDEITQEAILSLYFRNKPRNILEWLLLKTKSFWFKLFGVSNFQTITQSFSAVFALVGIYSLKNTIICFDDLERMDKNIDFQDFLGFVNDLAEQQECKIVLIFNEDELFTKQVNKNNERIVSNSTVNNTVNQNNNINNEKYNSTKLYIYNKYKEKTIDIEVTYTPSFMDSFEIAYNITKPDIDEKYILIVRNILQNENENNIRIIIKCIACVSEFVQTVEIIKDKIYKYNDFANTILLEIIKSITFITQQYWKAGHRFWDNQYIEDYKKEKNNGDYKLMLNNVFHKPLSTILKGKYLETIGKYIHGFNFDADILLNYFKDYKLLIIYNNLLIQKNIYEDNFWNNVNGIIDDYVNNMCKLFEDEDNAYSYFINKDFYNINDIIKNNPILKDKFKDIYYKQMNKAIDRYIKEFQNSFNMEYDFEIYRKIESINPSKQTLLYKLTNNADDYHNLLINIIRNEFEKPSIYLLEKLEYNKYKQFCNENNEFFIRSKSLFFEREEYLLENKIPHFLYITAKYLLETIEINPDNEIKYDVFGKSRIGKNDKNYSAKRDLEEYIALYESNHPESK